MIPEIERYTDTLKQALTRQRQHKGLRQKRPWKKETVHTSVYSKERPNHKCWWQTKNQWLPISGMQTADTKWKTKELKPPRKPKRWPTCKHKVEREKSPPPQKKNNNKQTNKKKTKKPTTPNHNSLIDYCLSVCNKWVDDYTQSQSHKSKE